MSEVSAGREIITEFSVMMGSLGVRSMSSFLIAVIVSLTLLSFVSLMFKKARVTSVSQVASSLVASLVLIEGLLVVGRVARRVCW